MENFSASVDVEIKLLASSYKFMSNPFTITWQLKIQILVEIPKMVQSYILENLQAACDKSVIRKKYLQIDWMIKNDEKLLGSIIKYAGQQQWLFSMLLPLKMEKSRRKLFRASHIMLLWGQEQNYLI